MLNRTEKRSECYVDFGHEKGCIIWWTNNQKKIHSKIDESGWGYHGGEADRAIHWGRYDPVNNIITVSGGFYSSTFEFILKETFSKTASIKRFGSFKSSYDNSYERYD